MITCDWKNASEAMRARFPDATAFHDAHGDDLEGCDAWRCDCGNRPDLEGFYGADDDQRPPYRCDRCGKLYDANGQEVQG